MSCRFFTILFRQRFDGETFDDSHDYVRPARFEPGTNCTGVRQLLIERSTAHCFLSIAYRSCEPIPLLISNTFTSCIRVQPPCKSQISLGYTYNNSQILEHFPNSFRTLRRSPRSPVAPSQCFYHKPNFRPCHTPPWMIYSVQQ